MRSAFNDVTGEDAKPRELLSRLLSGEGGEGFAPLFSPLGSKYIFSQSCKRESCGGEGKSRG